MTTLRSTPDSKTSCSRGSKIFAKILILAFGGALGTLCRLAVSRTANLSLGYNFPWGTLAVNLLGSLLVGVAWALLEDHHFSFPLKLFLFTGFFGGFTTFSAFAIENVNLFREGANGLALLYIGLTNVLGLTFVFAGFYSVKLLAGR